jgi:hypothetical protein
MVHCFAAHHQPPLPCLQFLSGTAIRSAQIPFLPASAQALSGWFDPLPLAPDTYYLPGALIGGVLPLLC